MNRKRRNFAANLLRSTNTNNHDTWKLTSRSNRLRFWAIFIVDVNSSRNAQQNFIIIVKTCEIISNERVVKSWLSSIDRFWLLLIDNANDISFDIEKYLFDDEHDLTLITTRNSSIKNHETIDRRFYRFDKLKNDETIELLLKIAEKKKSWTFITMQLTFAIIQKLSVLSFALVHVDNVIKTKYCEMSDYISYYEERWHNIRQNRHLTNHDENEAEYIEIYVSYEIVFRNLKAINTRKYRDVVQLLKLFSFFHYEHVPFDVLLATVDFSSTQRNADVQKAIRINAQQSKNVTWLTRSLNLIEWIFSKEFERQNSIILSTFLRDAKLDHLFDDWQNRFRETLFLFIQLSLIIYYEVNENYSMHSLIHTWIRKRSAMTLKNQIVWCEANLHTLSRCISLSSLNEREDFHGNYTRKLLSHIISLSKFHRKIEQKYVNNRKRRKSCWFSIDARFIFWRAFFLTKCAFIYSECDDFVQTAKNLKIVMKFNRNYLKANHSKTERVALTMIDCLWQQCRVNEAIDVQKKIYEENRKSLNSNHFRTLKLMNLLSESRRHQDRFAKFLQLFDKILTNMRRQLPDTDFATYRVLEQLKISLRVCFQFRKACRCLEEVVADLNRCLKNDDIESLVTRKHLVITYIELGTTHKDQLSCEYLNVAHEIASFVVEKRTIQFDDKQSLTWQTQSTLDRILAAKKAIVKIEKIFSFILPIVARHLRNDHVDVLSHKNHYFKILMQQNRLDDVEIILLKIFRSSKYDTAISLGDHSDRWNALWNLMICYLRQEKINQSLCVCEELLKAVIAIQDEKLQTETSKTFWTLIQHKREEILILKANDVIVILASTMFASNCDQNLAPISPGIQAKSSGVQIAAVNLRARGTTW